MADESPPSFLPAQLGSKTTNQKEKPVRLTKLGQAVVMSIIVAAIAITSWAVQNHEKKTAGDCTAMVSGTVTDAQWNHAVKEGWKGHAGDGMEALWSPECGEEDNSIASWDVDTASDQPSEYTEVPVGEDGMPMTNPCPFQAQMDGQCEGGW